MATAKKETKKAEVFKFESEVEYLYVDVVNAQFRKGKFETEDEKVAEVLRYLEAVKEV